MHVRVVSHFHDTGRRARVLTRITRKGVSVLVNARGLLRDSIGFGSLNLLVISRRRHFKIHRGRHVGTVHTGISVLALATAPVPHALGVTVDKVHSLSVVTAPPTHHLTIGAFIHRCSDLIIQRTVLHRVLHKKRICCLCGSIRGVRGTTRQLTRLIPRTQVTVNRKRVHRHRLRQIVGSFRRRHFGILIYAAVVRAKVSVPATGAVVVRHTSRFNLTRLRRLHNHIKHSRRRTCT